VRKDNDIVKTGRDACFFVHKYFTENSKNIYEKIIY
jgi:hypothetical protein